MPLIFLEGVLPERNEIIIHELHGHVQYMNRQPNLDNNEQGMTLLKDDGTVLAEGFDQVYAIAHGYHRQRARQHCYASG